MCAAPWNFSWLIADELALMAWPQTAANLDYLSTAGVRCLITLSPEKRPPCDDRSPAPFDRHLIAVDEFEAPRIRQIVEFIDICERCRQDKKPVAVHCRVGRGRTGTMAACYLIRFERLSPDAAISALRRRRPGSIETAAQERAVRRYHDYLRGTSTVEDLERTETALGERSQAAS